MNKIKKVGFLSKNIINYVGANLPEQEIILTKEVDMHIKNSHPNDYIYLNNVEDIINFPDYVGINSKHPNSMEFIKIMGDNILVAVRLSDNNELYVASLYKINNLKLSKRLNNKTIKSIAKLPKI